MNNKSITYILFIKNLKVLLLLLAIVFIPSVHTYLKNEDNNVNASKKNILKNYVMLIKKPLQLGDIWEAKKIIKKLVSNNLFSYVVIYNKENNEEILFSPYLPLSVRERYLNALSSVNINIQNIYLGKNWVIKAYFVKPNMNNEYLAIIVVALLFISLYIFITFINSLIYKRDYKALEFAVENSSLNKPDIDLSEEANNFLLQFKDVLMRMNLEIEKNQNLIISEEKSRINKQIAHDIRSPLEALKSIVGELDDLDYSTKQIITNSVGRISDIANGLLKSGQDEQKEFSDGSFRILMDDLIGDKQFEYARKIHYIATLGYKDSYMSGNENTLYRAISNIINNAVEASKKENKIDVKLSKGDLGIQLSIADQGSGMSEEFIAKVLEGGITTKEKGNGLGLSFAKKTIEEHKGHFQVESKEGKGTTILIELPTITTPVWFTDEIVIDQASDVIVCVDDDPSFLQLYKDKLADHNVKTFSEKKIDIVLNETNAQFFFDYDLGKEYSGLDFIIDNGLSDRSTLVTSMHQDKEIQKRCIDNGIKILPKQVFNNAKTTVASNEVSAELGVSHILIDDDYLMHMSWKMEADKQGLSFKSFHTVDEFIQTADEFSKDSVIYVDSNLAEGIKGEVESEKISKLGYKNIYLATGYAPEDIDKPEWIKEVVRKRAQFK